MPKYWMLTNRNVDAASLGNHCIENLSFYTADGPTEGMANLCYRITALYAGKDSVLGLSAGLKHIGKRRLGRSGLDTEEAGPDNVWDFDCTALFKPSEREIHSACFWTSKIQAVLKSVLKGYDRGIIEAEHA